MATAQPPLRPLFTWVAAVLVGMAGAACYGAQDVTVYISGRHVLDSVQGILFWMALASVVVVPCGAVAALCAIPLSSAIQRSQVVGILIGITLQVVAAITLALPFAVLFLPFAWLVAIWLGRVSQLGSIEHLATGCAVFVLGLLVASSASAVLDLHSLRWLLPAAAMVCTVTVVTMRRAAQCPRPTLAIAVIGLAGLIVSSFAVPRFSSAAANLSAAPPRAGAPNVVLIVLDTTRRDHLGAYGNTPTLSPNLDRMAAESTVYDQAIGAADWTVPSHASMFTGLYAVTHGASFAHHRWLDDRFVTLAEMLKSDGYQTVGLSANRYIHVSNLQQGIDHYVSLVDYKGATFYQAALALGAPTRWVDKGATRAVGELNEWLHNAYDASRPFFLFVNLMEPHWRYFPPWRQRLAQLPSGMHYWDATRISAGFFGVNWLAERQADTDRIRAVRALYRAEVAYQDEQLGTLLATLRRAVDFDNTIVLITADHGENLGEASRWDHVFAVNDYLVHVPLIIRYPPLFPGGRRIAGQCQLVDIVPTIYDVLGRPAPVADLPGRTLVPAHFQPRVVTFSESVPYYDHLERMSAITGMQRDIANFTATLRAIRTDRYKYVWSSDGNDRLYDLQRDPDEATDVQREHPDVAERLRGELHAWWEAQPHYVHQDSDGAPPPAAPLADAERERLRMLGYMQ